MWADHGVAVRRARTKRVGHPVLDPIESDCRALAVPSSEMRLIVYVPEPGWASAGAFASLARRVAEDAGAGALLPD